MFGVEFRFYYRHTGQIRGLVRLLLIEAIARVIKNELNLLFRKKVRDATLPLEVTLLLQFVFFHSHAFVLHICPQGAISQTRNRVLEYRFRKFHRTKGLVA